jgi:hypothetical protein
MIGGWESLSPIQLADLMAADAIDGVLDVKQFGQEISSGSYRLDSYPYRGRNLSRTRLSFSLTPETNQD